MNKQEVAYCKRCGRRLKDPLSKERGYGKTCLLKVQSIKTKPLITVNKSSAK